ncbi:MAG: hypothetical protein CL675_07460 [Bdellovibrionaceae bacterium]|nr:hypothetical protein [Pseudobdellovibrionaceae bacterium]
MLQRLFVSIFLFFFVGQLQAQELLSNFYFYQVQKGEVTSYILGNFQYPVVAGQLPAQFDQSLKSTKSLLVDFVHTQDTEQLNQLLLKYIHQPEGQVLSDQLSSDVLDGLKAWGGEEFYSALMAYTPFGINEMIKNRSEDVVLAWFQQVYPTAVGSVGLHLWAQAEALGLPINGVYESSEQVFIDYSAVAGPALELLFSLSTDPYQVSLQMCLPLSVSVYTSPNPELDLPTYSKYCESDADRSLRSSWVARFSDKIAGHLSSEATFAVLPYDRLIGPEGLLERLKRAGFQVQSISLAGGAE